jgi:cytochrome b561
MAAISLLGSDEAADRNRRRRFPFFVGAVGIAGVLRDSWPTLLHWPPINLHAAFGTMLWAMVVAHFLAASVTAPLAGDDVRELSRRLSRLVYLLLYVVFGAQQLLRFAAKYGKVAAEDASYGLLSQPSENLRDYFAYGLLALITIRALAALSVRRPPALRMNLQLAPAEGEAARR